MFNWYFVIALVSAVLIGIIIGDNFFVQVGQRIHYNQRFRKLDPIFKTLSCTPFIVIVLFLTPFVFFALQQDWYTAAALTAGCFLSLGTAFVGKYIFQRARPLGHTTYLGKIDSAFPSAHTAGSFAAAFSLMVFWDWSLLALAALALAGFIAVSRMYLQLHFLSDVAGGILFAHVMVSLVLGSDFLLWLGFPA